jgi:ABC-2 type transport system ATP-binding protein
MADVGPTSDASIHRTVEQSGSGRFRLLSEGDVRPQAAAAVVKAGGALRELSFEEPSLGAIYHQFFRNRQAVNKR